MHDGAPRIDLVRTGAGGAAKEWRERKPLIEHAPKILKPPFVAFVDDKPIMVALENIAAADALHAVFEQVTYSKTDRSSGMVTRSRVFGYNPRNAVRRDYCSSSTLQRDFPGVWRLLVEQARRVSTVYESFLPEHYAQHLRTVEKVLPHWRIAQTPFTSGIINQSAALPYHRDAGNFADVWSCMLVTRKDIEGAELVLPELGVSVDMPHGGLLMFDGQKWLHGVAPIKPTRIGGRRYSCVFYSLRKLWECLVPDEELARFRRVKTQKERKRV